MFPVLVHGQVAGFVVGDGLVVVGQTHGPNGSDAFKWTSAGGMLALDDLPGGSFLSSAFAVSGDGSVVARKSQSGWSAPDDQEAFRWAADGSVIFGGGDAGYCQIEGFRGTAETGMVSLGPDALRYGVSADGSVGIGVKNNEAYVWDEVHGLRYIRDIMTDQGIDLSDWNALGNAGGIPADGKTIVGIGFHNDATLEAWIAHIPEPATFWLLTVDALITLHRRPAPPRSTSL